MQSSSPALAMWPTQSFARDAGLVVAGATLTTVGAQIQIPWQPVPFTLQTLAVMLCGLGMGRRLGAMSQILYLGAGAAGLPVFAGPSGGFSRIVGPTGGYLISFVFVAALLGTLSDRGWTRNIGLTAAAFVLGIGLNLGLGTLWLALFIGMKAAFLGGCAPFVGIELGKAALVVPILPRATRFAHLLGGEAS